MLSRSIGALTVSTVGLGCSHIGRELDAEGTRQVVHAALDNGITFFDTADRHGNPFTAGESLLGPILKPYRNEVVLATKVGRWLDTERGGASPTYVRTAVEASLRRLQTDRIDLLQIHGPDPATPIEETLGALGDLIAQGKVREIGHVNVSAKALSKANDLAETQDLPRFVSAQLEYSMLHRRAVSQIVAECENLDIRLLPSRPLYHGLLTGSYQPGIPLPTRRGAGAKSAGRHVDLLSAGNMAMLEALSCFAQERGHNILEMAFAWLLAHDAVPSVIANVASSRQVAANAAAARWELTPQDFHDLNSLLNSLNQHEQIEVPPDHAVSKKGEDNGQPSPR